jgi:hypothetical protein
MVKIAFIPLLALLASQLTQKPDPPEVTVSQLTRRLNGIAQRYTRWRTTEEKNAQLAALYQAIRDEAPRFRIESRGRLKDATWKNGWATLNITNITGELVTQPVSIGRSGQFKIPITREETLKLRPQMAVTFIATIEHVDYRKSVDFPGTDKDPPTLYSVRLVNPASTSLGQYVATSYTISIGEHSYSYAYSPKDVTSNK